VLDASELALVWREAGDDEFGKAVRLLILLGQRRAEIGGMRHTENCAEGGIWTIPKERTKNGRTHSLALPMLALDIINSIPRQLGRDHVFGGRSESGFTAWSAGKRALDSRLGNRVKPWTLHDLRRTFCTHLGDHLGVLPHVIEAAVNHQSGAKRGVAGIYNRSPYARDVRAALAMWADHVRALAEGDERKVLPFEQRATN
jgi:integrase